jgi:hypothetical protein
MNVRDRYGNLVALPDERWDHIVSYHPELEDHLADVIETIRRGRRKQDPLDPLKWKYIHPCPLLAHGMTHIVVVVRKRQTYFVLTAYPV